MRAASLGRAALATLGLTVAATACSSPAPLEIDDIELPPGVESYEGAQEVPIDFLLSQVIETLPDDTDLDYRVYYSAGATADVNQWLSGAVARAGFEESDQELVSVESRWTRGRQALTWSSIPFVQADSTSVEVLVLMLITND